MYGYSASTLDINDAMGKYLGKECSVESKIKREDHGIALCGAADYRDCFGDQHFSCAAGARDDVYVFDWGDTAGGRDGIFPAWR